MFARTGKWARLQPSAHTPTFSVIVACLALFACASDDQAYYPLESGYWWYYAVTQTILGDAQEHRYIVKNIGPGSLRGEAVVARASQQGATGYLRREGALIERVARSGADGTLRSDDPPHVVLPRDRAVGATWRVESSLGLIESRTFASQDRVIVRRKSVTLQKTVGAVDDTVVGPRGTFAHCLRIDGKGVTSIVTDRGNTQAVVTVSMREWFAPGIGLVKIERAERSDSPFLKDGEQSYELLAFGR